MQSHPAEGAERRRFSRISFHRPAELTVGGRAVPCRVLDLSLKGALLEVDEPLGAAAALPCALDIRLDALGVEHIRMDGEVVHVEGGHAGFVCDGIDLESITHLRRFVELNLGDEDALHRELGALVGARRH